MNKIWIYPGSFDPFTIGHLDIVERAARLCDELIVAILPNAFKKYVFTEAERMSFIEQSVQHLANVSVRIHRGLVADFYEQVHASAVVKGIRNQQDMQSEFEQAAINQRLNPSYETLCLPCRSDLMYISSSVVKDLMQHGGHIQDMVPAAIYEDLRSSYRSKTNIG